jgi:2-C-methyl-D-erythritol 4-phosphate cytidylyltransferase
MVAHTLSALAGVARLELVLVALAPDDEEFERRVDLPAGKRFAVSRCGGHSRAETVAAGLSRLLQLGARRDDWVLVHDAARCLVRPEWIDRLIDVCADDLVGGLLAMPVADTLKREATGRVMATLPRDGIWQAQTPQMFRLGLLGDALRSAGASATDEASAIEWQGLSPRLVPGSSENFKITQPEDFALAEAVLRSRRREQ